MKPKTWAKTKSEVITYKPWVPRAAGRDNTGIMEEFRDRGSMSKAGVRSKVTQFFRLIHIASFYSKQVDHDMSDLQKGYNELRIEIQWIHFSATMLDNVWL